MNILLVNALELYPQIAFKIANIMIFGLKITKITNIKSVVHYVMFLLVTRYRPKDITILSEKSNGGMFH